MRIVLLTLTGAVLALPALAAPAGLRSGPQPGQSPLPFTSTMVTGENRGRQHCYVCDLKDEPAILVFARRMDPPTAQLLQNVRDTLREHRKAKLFGWFVFLGDRGTPNETALERQAYAFAREHGATNVPISVLGDPQGPPGYLIAPEAAVTIVMFRSGRVIANRTYRADGWNARAPRGALEDLPKLLAADPAPQAPAERRGETGRSAR